MKEKLKKLKRKIDFLSYKLDRKLYSFERKIARMKVPDYIYVMLIALVYVFMLSGGVYVLMEEPLFYHIVYPIYPSVWGQTVAETILIMFTCIMGISGLYMYHIGSKNIYNRDYALKMFVLGTIFIFTAIAILMYAISVKIAM